MKLTVKRIRQGKNSTLSEVYLDGKFLCYGLEDLVREVKIKGATAIPAGVYPLRLNTYGAMNARYKRRFPEMHRGMIEICDIPNFTYVYIHIGNNFGDTAGCLLVGDSYAKDDDGDYILLKSAKAYKRLYALLVDVVGEGEVAIH
ncbi:DUF5675 family protein [Sphingobacterium paucimobilis]|uniref:DUF5675 domain-containing protein n=1 Tax=Sphingobacterium paucimobilis HER1398 TaxID=1346330 RepID=U2I1A2_9SPHI|nr:DUF5675 family protein [Sphingobacterium paucimobilis]ERJ61305.1 hypothetical protein M472_21355 [Sphingobacterium paucimobilis HER1398]